MTSKSEFSLDFFVKENVPRPEGILQALQDRTSAVGVLVDYWIAVQKVLQDGIDCSSPYKVAALLYKVDLLKLQENQVLALKNTAICMINCNLFVEENYLQIVQLHKICHYFLTVVSPVLRRDLVYIYGVYVNEMQKRNAESKNTQV